MDTFLIIKNGCACLPTDELKQYTVFQVKTRSVSAALNKHKKVFPEYDVLISVKYDLCNTSTPSIYSIMKNWYGSKGVKAKLFQEKFNTIGLVEGVTHEDFCSCVLTAVDEWKKQTNPDTGVCSGKGKEDCSICCDTMNKRSLVLKCKHEFCYKCIHKWYIESTSKACPVCRTFIDKDDIERGGKDYCTICCDTINKQSVVLKCKHEFCYKCISDWYITSTSKACPVCITPIKWVDIEGKGKDYYCLICYDALDRQSFVLRCKHEFCYKCIKGRCLASTTSKYCPACKTSIDMVELDAINRTELGPFSISIHITSMFTPRCSAIHRN